MDGRKTIGVLGLPFSKGQPRSGTEFGPQALRKAGLISHLEELNEVIDHGNLSFTEYDMDMDGNTKNPKTVGQANKKISDAVAGVINKGQLCLNLGGDHSVAIGSIHGHAKAESNMVVVWIDAHADVNTPLTSSSGNIHGMPLSFLIHELKQYSPKLNGFEWCTPCMSLKDLVYIGLRDVDTGERKMIDQFGIKAYSMKEVDELGIGKVVEGALKHVDPTGTRPIHCSFDVDGLDAAICPSTGTPVNGGLTLREGQYIMEKLADTGRLSCVDVVEVNPSLGNKDDVKMTTDTAIQVLGKCFGYKRCGQYPSDYTLPKANK